MLSILKSNKTTNNKKEDEPVLADYVENAINPKKINCNETSTMCFANSECQTSCNFGDAMKCVNGLCRNKYIYKTQTEECNPKNGYFGYLIGEPAFGRFRQVCKSIDPGIATPYGNLMCRGGDISIDYRIGYPSIENCRNCKNPIIIPATPVKRAHIECNDKFYNIDE